MARTVVLTLGTCLLLLFNGLLVWIPDPDPVVTWTTIDVAAERYGGTDFTVDAKTGVIHLPPTLIAGINGDRLDSLDRSRAEE